MIQISVNPGADDDLDRDDDDGSANTEPPDDEDDIDDASMRYRSHKSFGVGRKFLKKRNDYHNIVKSNGLLK